MGAAQEQVVHEFMDAWGDGTQEVPDIEKILSMFSDDAVWQLWVPGGPTLQGRDAVRADIERQLRFATFMRCGPVHVTSNDRVVVTERVDEFQSKGQRVEHHLVRGVRGRRRRQDCRLARVLRSRGRQPSVAGRLEGSEGGRATVSVIAASGRTGSPR